MKKIFIVFLLLFSLTLTGCNKKTTVAQIDNQRESAASQSSTIKNTTNDYPVSSIEQIADKLEVYYFHRTARCYSCKTIGQYVRETMEQKYGEQIKNGLIDFRELNVELPENKEVAMKFQASGSSLYVNRIIGEKDNIEQDTNVWRLLSDETEFKSYLENQINSYLGI